MVSTWSIPYAETNRKITGKYAMRYLDKINKILAETVTEQEYRDEIKRELLKKFSPDEVKTGMEHGDDWIKKIGGFPVFMRENSLESATNFFYACCNVKHELAANWTK